MRHPIEKCNEEQARVLASLPDDQREFWARQFQIGNASYRYQDQFAEVAKLETAGGQPPPDDLIEWLEQMVLLNPDSRHRSANELLQVYYAEWLEGLPENTRRSVEKLGLEDAKKSWPFRRYVLERNDRGMDEFLKRNLSAEDYAYHQSLGESLKKNF